jgi:type I restriction enzyme S subunit
MAASTNAPHIPSTAAALPAGWRWERLEDVCSGVFDCPHSTPVLTADGPLIVRSQDIRSGVFRVDEAAHVSEDTYRERISRAELVLGDLLYSREGTYFGIAAEVPPGTRVCLGQRMVLLRPEPTKVHFRFLRFWLNSRVMASHIHGYRDGTVAERLNLPTIRGLPVALPPLSEQRAIAHILGTLDDKIELNRRMNETLEAMARAIFQSWFVDFDPVRAETEGRDPGLPKEIADLFPDRFEDYELGDIPAGWWVRPFSAMVEIIGGGTPKTSVSEYWGGNIPWFSVMDAPSESDVFVINTEKRITQEGLENSMARLLPEGTTIISARGTVGKLALVGVPMTVNQSCYGLRGIEVGSNFTYYATRNLVSILKQHSHGSVFDTITRDTLAGVNFITPPKAVLEAFEWVADPFMQRIKSNLSESSTLANLRNTLLPKLTSGELRIRNVDCFDLRGA